MTGQRLIHRTEKVERLRAFLLDDRGQAATEYILVIGLIIIPLAVAFNAFQDVLKAMLEDLALLFSGPGV